MTMSATAFDFMNVLTLQATFSAEGEENLLEYPKATIRGIMRYCFRGIECKMRDRKCFVSYFLSVSAKAIPQNIIIHKRTNYHHNQTESAIDNPTIAPSAKPAYK